MLRGSRNQPGVVEVDKKAWTYGDLPKSGIKRHFDVSLENSKQSYSSKVRNEAPNTTDFPYSCVTRKCEKRPRAVSGTF